MRKKSIKVNVDSSSRIITNCSGTALNQTEERVLAGVSEFTLINFLCESIRSPSLPRNKTPLTFQSGNEGNKGFDSCEGGVYLMERNLDVQVLHSLALWSPRCSRYFNKFHEKSRENFLGPAGKWKRSFKWTFHVTISQLNWHCGPGER